jgi:hypothetical protein
MTTFSVLDAQRSVGWRMVPLDREGLGLRACRPLSAIFARSTPGFRTERKAKHLRAVTAATSSSPRTATGADLTKYQGYLGSASPTISTAGPQPSPSPIEDMKGCDGSRATGTPRVGWPNWNRTGSWPSSSIRTLGRRTGVFQIILHDIDPAVAEPRWARDAGLTGGGVLLPGAPPGAGVLSLHHHSYYDCTDGTSAVSGPWIGQVQPASGRGG